MVRELRPCSVPAAGGLIGQYSPVSFSTLMGSPRNHPWAGFGLWLGLVPAIQVY